MTGRLYLAIVLGIGFGGFASAQTQIINDGGFEGANAGAWQISGNGAFITNGTYAETGTGYLSMGNVNGANQTAYQTVTFPTNLISAVFSFGYVILTSDFSASDDILSAAILDTNQNVLVNIGSVANVNAVSPPIYYDVSTNLATYQGGGALSVFAGKTVQILFKVTTDASFGSLTEFNIDNVSVVIGTLTDVPSNDDFASSIALAAAAYPIAVSGTNTFATRQTGEPKIANNAGGHSLWWNWTAPTNGVVTLNTTGSSITTLLGVYTGSSVSNLTEVAFSNGNSRGGAAQVTFGVTAGTQYQIAVDGYSGQTGTVDLSLNFSLDSNPPKISITFPAANAKITNSTVVVTGTASDIVDVSLVEYRLENAAGTNEYLAATGTNTWTATVTNLAPGPNTIRVRAFDLNGNVSPPAARTVNFIVVSPITLSVSGSGTVSPNLNGRLLNVGSQYTMTARPGAGSVFAGWTGDFTSISAKLVFTMQSNMVLQANFAPNPFTPVMGVYQGLFYDTNGIAFESSGFVNVTITGTGAYSAKGALAGNPRTLHGQFSAAGVATNYITPKGLPAVAVQLQLNFNDGSLSGILSGGGWTAELTAFRARSSPPTGSYTLLLPGIDGNPAQPAGDGFGTVKVDKTGKLRFTGELPDGTTAVQQSIVTSRGWPFYVALHGGAGSILGWLGFHNDVTNDIDGQLNWFKLPQAGRYPAGFTNQLQAVGSAYSFTIGVPILNFTDGQVWLTDGGLSSGITNLVVLGADSKVENKSGNALSLTISKPTGLFQGSVANPATGESMAFKGVVLQKQNFGGGLFLGTDQSGRVFFGP